MIVILYSSPNELEISGTTSDLRAIRDVMIALGSGNGTGACIVADAAANPQPYGQAIGSLTLNVTGGPIRISVSQRGMEVEGSRESFEVFASFFDFDDQAKPGTHYHHDFLGNESYVHPESVPLVVAVGATM